MSVEVKNVSYEYLPGTPFAHTALQDVSLTIGDNECLAVLGSTGSGKSTLMQHLNGLLQPTTGQVLVDGTDISPKRKKKWFWQNDQSERRAVKEARQKVGMVFQYPEQQLFEETVFEDVAFGVKQQGMEGEALFERVKKALEVVRLDFAAVKDVSPFALSGGQMRRVAIAGVLAMRPKYLVLDEPTAGLDPFNRRELMAAIMRERRKNKTAVVLVTHNMETAAEFADRIAVLHRGRLILLGTPTAVFAEGESIKKAGLTPPPITMLLASLKQSGLVVNDNIINFAEGIAEILRVLKKCDETR